MVPVSARGVWCLAGTAGSCGGIPGLRPRRPCSCSRIEGRGPWRKATVATGRSAACLVPLQVAWVTLHDGRRELMITRKCLRQPLVPQPVRDLGNQHWSGQDMAEGIEWQKCLEGLQVLRNPGRKRLAAYW